MDQDHNNIFLAEIPVKAGAAADQFIYFAGNFYAAEARSHDDEPEMPTAELGIRGGFAGFHLTDDVLAKKDGVAHDLEDEGDVGRPGDKSRSAFGAAGTHSEVVGQ